MSFGVVQTMITTLKNNDKMRSKREKFKKRYGRNISKEKPEYDFPEATPELLKDISKRLKEERKVRMIKVITVTIFLITLLIGSIAYSAEGIIELLY